MKNKIEALAAEHLVWMRAMNYADMSVTGRGLALREFAAWCDERGITHPKEVSKAVLESYRRHVFHRRKPNGAPLTNGTQFKRLSDLRQWFRWLSRQDHIEWNPAADLEMPRREKQLPKNVLSVSEVDQVMNQPDVNHWQGVRDRAILEVFYSTGVRLAEAQQLKIQDLDLENRTVFIRQGKGKKDRLIPIGDRAARWLRRYLVEVRPELTSFEKEDAVFLRDVGEPLSVHGLTRLVRKYIKDANLGKQGACHLLRHSMATQMLENGADIRYIQQMLGHANIKSTQIYTQVSIRKLKEVHAKTHPGAPLQPRANTCDVKD